MCRLRTVVWAPVGVAFCAAALFPADDIRFSNESKTAGTFMQSRTKHPNPELAQGEWPPGGKTEIGYYAWPFDVVWMDANGDGTWDLFMANHAHGIWSRLWLGDGKGKFTVVPPEKLLAEGKSRGSFSLLPIDFGTGAQDLLLSDGDVPSSQFHYTGPVGKLAPESFAWVKETLGGATYTYLLADMNGDGNVDAAVGANRGAAGKVCFGKGQSWVKDFAAGPEAFVGFHSLAADMNGDGWPDILASDFGETRAKREFYVGLSLNDGKGGFKDVAEEAGLVAAPAGGNIVAADFNNDGLMDIYVCGYPSTKKDEGAVKLYLNLGGGKFRDATEGSGLEGPKAAWQTRYVKSTADDFDDDGLVDIVNWASTGFRLYQNLGGGKFKDVTETSGIAKSASGEPCAASADYDGDGLVDLAVLSEGVWLGRNVTQTKNGWMEVKVKGPRGNPSAAGASVTIYRSGRLGDKDAVLGHRQAIFSTDFHTTGSRLHFGLGTEGTCDVRAVYPGGKPIEQFGVKAKSRVTVDFEKVPIGEEAP